MLVNYAIIQSQNMFFLLLGNFEDFCVLLQRIFVRCNFHHNLVFMIVTKMQCGLLCFVLELKYAACLIPCILL